MIDGVFHDDAAIVISFAEEEAGEEIERLLAAVGDDEIVRRACDMRRRGIFEQVATQGRVAVRGTELQDLGSFGTIDDFFRETAEGKSSGKASGERDANWRN